MYKAIPESMRAIVFINNGSRPLAMSDTELESISELRGQVLRIWGHLRSSENFDPSLLQPILQVVQQPEARDLGGRVAGGSHGALLHGFCNKSLELKRLPLQV